LIPRLPSGFSRFEGKGFQAVAMMKALRAIIHQKATAKEASDLFEEEKKKG
jgi:hypothetical protein